MTAYLDHNATTSLKPAVIDLLQTVLRESGNPSSQHSAGRTARKYIEDARSQVAALVNYKPQNVIFTSGATEANNMIVQGYAGTILVSAVEHPSVLQVRDDAIVIPVDNNGLIDVAALENLLVQHKPQLVCVMAVNNETGVIQPVADIGAVCKRNGVLFHCDAVQAAGKIIIDFEKWNCDFMSLSAHKCGGPQGAGALIFRTQVPVPKLLKGGGQERRQRAGTENTAAIAGFGLAAELAVQDLEKFQTLSMLRNQIEKYLTSSLRRQGSTPSPIGDNGNVDAGLRQHDENIIIHAQSAPRVANVTNFSLKNANAQTLLMQFDLAGVCVSSGSACSSGSVKPSHVLQAMGVTDDLASSSVRVSLGWNSTQKDVDAFIAAWQRIAA